MLNSRSRNAETADYFDANAKRIPNTIDIYMKPSAHSVLEFKQLLDFVGLAETGADILEIGSGMGNYTIPLLKMGHRVSVIDLSRASLDILEKHSHDLDVRENLAEVFYGSFFDYPSRKQHDIVLGIDVLHHIVEKHNDVQSFFRKVKSLLKPGGKIIFKEPNPCFPWPLYFLCTPTMSWQHEKGIRFLTKSNIRFALEKERFSNIRFKNTGFFPGLGKYTFLVPAENMINRTPIIKMLSLKFLFSASYSHE